jgi:hypothetical protein
MAYGQELLCKQLPYTCCDSPPVEVRVTPKDLEKVVDTTKQDTPKPKGFL